MACSSFLQRESFRRRATSLFHTGVDSCSGFLGIVVAAARVTARRLSCVCLCVACFGCSAMLVLLLYGCSDFLDAMVFL